MERAQASLLPDGRRLHLHHGPIDLIAEVTGAGRADAYRRAIQRFETVLQELVDELHDLRRPVGTGVSFKGAVARRMATATARFGGRFITPMAAVAGAVADEILACLCADPMVAKAYVNNGGDVAFHLAPAQTISAALAGAPARLTITAASPVRGVASSGWRGRSHSLGIADSVTVLAQSAAGADAAATLIANAVDLPSHPGILRRPADTLSPDSDLGARLVTTDVPRLNQADRGQALDRGAQCADEYLRRGLICGGFLMLQDETRHIGSCVALPVPETKTLNA